MGVVTDPSECGQRPRFLPSSEIVIAVHPFPPYEPHGNCIVSLLSTEGTMSWCLLYISHALPPSGRYAPSNFALQQPVSKV